MNIVIVIIYGALVGFISSKIWGSGFGLWWDIYLGVAGSAFASCIMIVAYFMNLSANRDVLGLNLYSVTVDIIGALTLIYAARFYHEAIQIGIKLFGYATRPKLARINSNLIPPLFSRIKTSFTIKKVVSHTYG